RTRSPRKEQIYHCYLHSNSLSNKMDNSLLVVRDINHKYIVVDKEEAKKSILGKQVAHGMLVSSLISAILGTKFPKQGTIYLKPELRFKKPVFVGDEITAKVQIEKIVREKEPY
ncbi:MAG: MaoC/PaaZ C-terminal domain-containing protein, partial [Lachnospiraceae bacterium]|nr:MaoC/PaaZ C-terminal domain-containing protein [Lachnospiraceae bacterium]